MWVDMIAEDLLAAVRYKEDIMSNTQQSDNNVKAETYGIDQYVFNKAHSNDPIYLNTYAFKFKRQKNIRMLCYKASDLEAS